MGFLYISAMFLLLGLSRLRPLTCSCLVVVQLDVHAVVDLVVVECDMILVDVVPIVKDKVREKNI
jgi:hypothetical protein